MKALGVRMRFLLMICFLFIGTVVNADDIVMKCEGKNTFSYEDKETQGEAGEKVFKYQDTMFGKPSIKIRTKGRWQSW